MSTTSEPIETTAADDVDQPRPVEIAHRQIAPTAKLPPPTRQAGQTASMPRQPTCAATSQNGTIIEKTGNWRPTIALSCCRSSSGDFRERDERRAERAERHGRGVADERELRRLERLEAEPDHQRAADRHRRAEARRTFDESAEAEGDEQRLDAAIARDTRDLRCSTSNWPVVDREL